MKLAFLAITTSLLCLPASAQEYRVHVPAGVERVEWSAAGIGWDVDVSYDPQTCEVYCTYRRSHDVLGQLPILPPVTIVRFYVGPMEPASVAIDPAGVATPAVEGGADLPTDGGCTASKRFTFGPGYSPVEILGLAPPGSLSVSTGRPAKAVLSLRI